MCVGWEEGQTWLDTQARAASVVWGLSRCASTKVDSEKMTLDTLPNSVMRRLALLASASARVSGRAAASTSAPDATTRRAAVAADGRSLADFLPRASEEAASTTAPWSPSPAAAAVTDENDGSRPRRRYAIETYGCQMNSADSETIVRLLSNSGWDRVDAPPASPGEAGGEGGEAGVDAILVNTCTIRDGAEARVRTRLAQLKAATRGKAGRRQQTQAPVVAVLGCVAQRVGRSLVADRAADVAAGPDGYRDLARLLDAAAGGAGAGGAACEGDDPRVADALALEDTYADVIPSRRSGTVSALVSVQRGCSNHCAFCVVPRVRGTERSRPLAAVVADVRAAVDSGAREVTLLGQNVNSYAAFDTVEARLAAVRAARDSGGAATASVAHYAPGFATRYAPLRTGAHTFADLLAAVASIDPELRVRFTSPHPKDFSADVLDAAAAHPNVARCFHLPAQSGADAVLVSMARGYTRAAYDALVASVRAALPGVAITTDIIMGFCGETEADAAATIDLLTTHAYDGAFMFAYSERPGTHAARRLPDDVPPTVKSARLAAAVAAHRAALARASQVDAAAPAHLVLVEGPARRQPEAEGAPARLTGRSCRGRRIVFDDVKVAASYATAGASATAPRVRLQPGDYVAVRVTAPALGSLPGVPLSRTTLAEFVGVHGTTVPLGTVKVAPPP